MFGAEADRNGRSYLHVSIYIFVHLKTKIKRLRIVPRLIYCIDLSLSVYWIWLLYGYECI